MAEAAPVTDSCSCGKQPRRLCDICYSTERVHMACSAECLAQHQLSRHPEQAGLSARERAFGFASSVNGRFPDNWQRYAPHRQKLMQLVESAGTGGRLAVFGAGNASDLELEWLVQRFDQVVLIDVDAQALERACARHQVSKPERLLVRGGVDLSGLLGYLDDWGERFPEPQQLGLAALVATRRLVEELGAFDLTLSTCMLSQLALPFRRSWVASHAAWGLLTSAVVSIHLGTLVGCTRGQGILACDVQTTQRAPELDQFQGQDGEALERFVRGQLARGKLGLRPDPQQLLAWFRAPGLAQAVAEAHVLPPWLWDLGEVRQLVYGLTFRRSS